ncbi:MAG: cupredoxin domain-containing protein [Bradyrhizobium sp.]|nr:cupredoxin domain-containing protein [Bradyrhizobium sp.]
MSIRFTLAAICATPLLLAAPALAEQAVQVQLSYSNGAFQPSEVRASADKPVVFRIKNLDGKAMEFESTSLRVEKVVAAKSEGVINVRPLKAGSYEFYDDFNEKARGTLNVQ